MANILLIHGSWHGAWCWYKIVPRLRALGHRVEAPDLPGHGRDWTSPAAVTLATCLEPLLKIISDGSEPWLVVAHSRGGMVLSALSEAQPTRITRAVYLAAVLLQHGQTVFDLMGDAGDSLILPAMFSDDAATWDMLREQAFDEALYADCSPEDRTLGHLLLTPEPLAPSLTAAHLTPEGYGCVPRTYIELTEDRAVTPGWQRAMYTRVPCDEVLSLAASHSAYFSKPDELSALIDSLARQR